MTDISDWLCRHTLDKYIDLFLDNEIDVDILPELTDEILKELEIPVGARLKILKAIRQADFNEDEKMSVETSLSCLSIW